MSSTILLPASPPIVFPAVPLPSPRRRLSRLLFLMKCCVHASSIPTTENSIDFYSLSSRAPGALWQHAHKRVRYGWRGGVGREAGEEWGAIGVVRFVGWLPTTPHRQHVIHFTRPAAGSAARSAAPLASTPPAAAAASAPSEIFLLRLIIGRRG